MQLSTNRQARAHTLAINHKSTRQKQFGDKYIVPEFYRLDLIAASARDQRVPKLRRFAGV
jgi:hypothetical protein